MNTSAAPDAHVFLSHLGKPLETVDGAVFAFADHPDFELPEHSPIGGIFFKKLGFSITFCPPDFYHMNVMLANDLPIITNVQFYSGDEQYHHSRYAHPLPFGLTFDDDRAAVLARLGEPAWQYPFVAPFELERFDLLDRWIVIRYADNMSRISAIQIGLKAKKPKASVLPKIEQPDITTLQSLLESEWTQVAQHPAFEDIDLSEFAEVSPGESCPHEVDAVATHGVELYFRQSNTTDEPCSVLTGGRYIRQGLWGSVGFDGALPKGIRFEDGPEMLVKKVGSYPQAGTADFLSGYFVWRLPEYVLHVNFSVMEQRINRVQISVPAYFAPAILASPALTPPA